MFVYRDTSASPDQSAARPARELTEHDTAYWYDLLAEDPTPSHEEVRGPFEPLVSSNDPDPAHGRPTATAGPALPDAAPDQGPDDPARVRARKLEQLKDLYLTAEAIGEQNVDKHFDQLLAQQRDLISEYFRQPTGPTPTGDTPAGTGRAGTGRAGTGRAGTGRAGTGRAGTAPPETAPPGVWPSRASSTVTGPRDGLAADDTEPGAGVAAERPGAW